MSKVVAKPAAAPANRHQRRAAASGKTSRFAAAFGLEAPEKKDAKEGEEKTDMEKPERKEGESDEDYEKRCAEEKEKNEASTEEDEPEAETEEGKKEAAAFASGFQAANDRWAAVLSHKGAAGKGLIACHLLATTTMSADDIVSSLGAMPADAKAAGSSGLSRRMEESRVEPPAPSGAAAPRSATGMVTSDAIIAAAALARGEKPAAAR